MLAATGALASRALAHCQSVAAERWHWDSPELMMAYVPVVFYWLVAALYDALDHLQLPATERLRLRPQAEADAKNRVSRSHLLLRVALQHAIQVFVGAATVLVDPEVCTSRPQGGLLRTALEFVAAMFVMDAWQYLIHRAMHESKLLYNAIHSHHHRLLVCYAYGALYNHPLEALLLDTMGGIVTLYAAGLSCNTATWFFTFSTIKTVLDHSGYRAPINPLHDLLPNSATFHDVHHDPRGFRKNYSQPFFTHWDRLLGTYMHPSELKPLRAAGGAGSNVRGNGGGGASQGAVADADAGVDALPTTPEAGARDAAAKGSGRDKKGT